MLELFERYAFHWKQDRFIKSTIFGMLLLVVSLVINYVAGTYATAQASNSVTDLLLSHLPVLDVDGIFVEGFLLFLIVVVSLILWEPKRIPFVLKSLALFVLVRSFFIILTHIGPYPVQSLDANSTLFGKFNFTGDLFFSGHVGIPFLMSLIFWNTKHLRYLFLFLTFVFSATVLLGHYHYSIDVFGAYFITFSIFHLSMYFFTDDYAEFERHIIYPKENRLLPMIIKKIRP